MPRNLVKVTTENYTKQNYCKNTDKSRTLILDINHTFSDLFILRFFWLLQILPVGVILRMRLLVLWTAPECQLVVALMHCVFQKCQIANVFLMLGIGRNTWFFLNNHGNRKHWFSIRQRTWKRLILKSVLSLFWSWSFEHFAQQTRYYKPLLGKIPFKIF